MASQPVPVLRTYTPMYIANAEIVLDIVGSVCQRRRMPIAPHVFALQLNLMEQYYDRSQPWAQEEVDIMLTDDQWDMFDAAMANDFTGQTWDNFVDDWNRQQEGGES